MNSRRNFLKYAGLALGTAATSVPFSVKASNTKTNSYKAGILLPTSLKHAEYPESFMNGINLALSSVSAESCRIELIIESVKFGYPSQATRKAQKLVNENQVDLIVGLLNTEVAQSISEITSPAKIPTIIANAGENFPNDEMIHNPYLVFNTLDLCRNSALAGKFMVENFGKKLALVSGLYDSGYDAIYAFQHAVKESGGTITNVFINKQDKKQFYDHTIKQLKEKEVEGLFLLMNGEEANTFLQAYSRKKISIPVMTTSFVTEEKELLHAGNALNNVYHLSSWVKNLDNKENLRFVSAYIDKYGVDPDQFSLLGYQTGLIAERIQNNKSKNITSGDFAIDSPVGQLKMDTQTGMIEGPAYLCRTSQGIFSLPENFVLDKIETKNTFVNNHNEENIHSGWLNPYLFV
ncbi:ABC transporter substrate-binding protein [Maribellus sp. CM-23]|uniref:ABC transporter substrate-binding protein n=1 Tax=Maribellus sp. CM-23 TaxID=2781026 RepID=UPI001F36FC17|nr:ABC transporter substrate-binding protein [Maribellus sp. CM-23]MCE4564241.1 ABC transporter substrate-binding protein [Maribellus sp. CM-23]